MRTFQNLQMSGVKFWTKELVDLEKDSSIIPILINSQDKFISLLNISDANPSAWKETLKGTKNLPSNLFLKHLMVLSDIGGEKLDRFKTELPKIIINGKVQFIWNSHSYEYVFKTLYDSKTWSNKNLFLDGESLANGYELTEIMEDVAMLLLFGGAITNCELPEVIYEKCIIGELLGKNDELETFVKQRYIWVSRITGGATSNSLGQLAQSYVKKYLENHLVDWDFRSNSIKGVSQNDGRTPTKFDIIAKSPSNKYCAIEVSFQVTTNSVIERKAGQAESRFYQLEKNNYKIAYVIDGAGNFSRKSAVSTILRFSHCCITFNEFNKLKKFLEEYERRK
ncbi:MAG: restriction endonuclease [bacterium]